MKYKVSPENVFNEIGSLMLTDGLPMVLDMRREKSEGIYLYDSLNKKKWFDFFSFFASLPLKINNPELYEDEEFLEKLKLAALVNPTNSDIYTVEMAEFVKTFREVALPKSFKHLFLIAGGALAVENALKTAFDWKVQKNFRKGYTYEKGHKVIHFKESFHGRSGYTLSLTNTLPHKTMYFPKFEWPRIINPKVVFPLNHENLEKVVEAEKLAINQIKMAFYENKDDIAAIIIEPIQGEGGDNHFRKEFLVKLRELADENDALLIFDEVQTGLGLTGKMWAFEWFVEPDIFSFGKKTQVCGIACNSRIDEVPNNVFKFSGRINSTWGGNLVDMVRATKYLELIEKNNYVENALNSGKYLLEKIENLQSKYDEHINNARGRGLMCAFDFKDPSKRGKFIEVARSKNLLILPCGTKSVRFRPPLDITKEEIDTGLSLVEESLKETF